MMIKSIRYNILMLIIDLIHSILVIVLIYEVFDRFLFLERRSETVML